MPFAPRLVLHKKDLLELRSPSHGIWGERRAWGSWMKQTPTTITTGGSEIVGWRPSLIPGLGDAGNVDGVIDVKGYI